MSDIGLGSEIAVCWSCGHVIVDGAGEMIGVTCRTCHKAKYRKTSILDLVQTIMEDSLTMER